MGTPVLHAVRQGGMSESLGIFKSVKYDHTNRSTNKLKMASRFFYNKLNNATRKYLEILLFIFQDHQRE